VSGRAAGWSSGFRKKPTATAAFFPLSGRKAHHRRQGVMQLRSVVGVVKLQVWYGQDPLGKRWACPMRERWGLVPHQQMSPALEDKLAFTATLAGSYEQAAQLAAKWGTAVDDSVIHGLVQRLGRRAEAQTRQRLEQTPPESHPQRRASELAVLMADGWLARFRGPGWGQKKTQQERVEWHEVKTGVFYLLEQAARAEGGRGVIAEKTLVRWLGEPVELGRRLHWEALRGGLARARETLFVADGGVWIWRMKADRWPQARELLDFFHGGEHLWELGRAQHRGDESQAAPWVEQRLHRLRHGQEQKVLKEIAGLKAPGGEAGQTVRREQNYFASQAGRMNYQEMADRGWPIGSGSVESACRQSQCRFKRSGQFWTAPGLACLGALDDARHNGHWDELWLAA
jgi:hypothetical protein